MSHVSFHHVIDESGFPINRAHLDDYHVRTGSRNLHEQMWIKHIDGSYASVDVYIAPVITALWVAGVDTAFSCEGGVDSFRYVSTRTSHRFVAGDVLTRLGEPIIDQHGAKGRWHFQLSHQPLSIARYRRSSLRLRCELP
jgi:hypothetical protein